MMSYSTFKTLDTVKAEVRGRGLPLSTLHDLANMVPFTETDEAERVVGLAVESVFRDKFAATITGLSYDRLTARNRDTVDDTGYYHDRANRAISDAITAELERRHPDTEPTDTFTRDSNIGYSEHERRVYMAATPCENHGGDR